MSNCNSEGKRLDLPRPMAASELESRTRYDPAETESRVFARWRESGLFHPEPKGTPEENYSIAIPPPNVTGALHMGHALNGSIQDTLIRHNRMVNWDPGLRSAISDLEVEDREVTDTLYYIDYPLASGHGSVTIATVRPETMLADTAIAVNPDDDRYTRLIGETAILPLMGPRLRIIADPYVKPEFGTGALKITPGHDPNDFEIGRAHKLEEIMVIGEDGRMTEAAGRFAGMTVLEAREAVVDP